MPSHPGSGSGIGAWTATSATYPRGQQRGLATAACLVVVGQATAVHKYVEEEQAAEAQPAGDAAEQLAIVLRWEGRVGTD